MKRTVAVVLLAGLAFAFTGCSKDKNKDAATTFNSADVTFVHDMIPHHKQAVEMANMALMQTKTARVVSLATKIKAAQDPEIKQMQGFLKSWGKSEATTSVNQDMGSMGGGMMSDSEMKALGKAKGAEFDKMFLDMMTKHHQGAVKMAMTEQKDGKSSDAKSLAGKIIRAQNAEITEMKDLLASV